jgi:hypothetical protein
MKTVTCWLMMGLSLMSLAIAKSSWQESYAAGLKEAGRSHWIAARKDFLEAAQDRPRDTSRPTELPGDPTEPQEWRNGAAYSPNFLAAYSAYRAALDSRDVDEQTSLLRTAATELEHLVAAGQTSRDAYFILDLIYTRLGEDGKRHMLAESERKNHRRLSWRVDEEIVAPEEVAAMALGSGGTVTVTGPETATTVQASETTTGATGQLLNPIVPGLGIGNVPTIPDKYALVIGESGAKLPAGQAPYAAQDVQTIRDGLVSFAGYASANVVTLVDAKATDILMAAKNLAAKVPQDGVVLLFYVGPGTCLNGKDYLIGGDAESLTDPEAMMPKMDIYSQFLSRGARIFSFFEVNRPLVNGYFFGSEVPQVGAIAQMEATIPESDVSAIVYKGATVGLFAKSFAQVLAELRSNRVPIYEFGWQLYNKMRRGDSGAGEGSGHQIPTLPVLNMLASDARF